MPRTLLAVDDSATMRKVLEITFGGEDFRVMAEGGASGALGRLGEGPVAAVIDASLGTDDGYALAKEIRSRDPRIAVILMASRYVPYDANRGRDAGVDDFIDKPFDTQALIEKVKKALVVREAGKAAVGVAQPAPASGSRVPGIAPAPPMAPSITSKPATPIARSHTLSFEGGMMPGMPGGPPAAHAVPQSLPQSPVRRPSPTGTLSPHPPAHAAPAPAAPRPGATSATHGTPSAPLRAAAAPASVAATATASNGRLAGKLGEMGLTQQQVEAVLALSREVVERVVWEVVPQLAETIIKEEVARLTKEG